MPEKHELKIDAYAHIIAPKYREALYKVAPEMHDRPEPHAPADIAPLWFDGLTMSG